MVPGKLFAYSLGYFLQSHIEEDAPFIVGYFFVILGKLFAYSLGYFLQSHIEKDSFPPLPYKRELKRKEYHQLFAYSLGYLLQSHIEEDLSLQLTLIRQRGEGVFFDVGRT